MTLILLLTFCIILVSISAEQSNKLARRIAKAPMPFSSSSSSSTNIESKYTTKQLVKSNKSFQTTDSNLDIGKMLKGSLNNVKDEIEDIFDAVIFAENTEERVEAIVEVALRHKVLIGTCAAIPVMRNVMLRERAQRAGMELAQKEKLAQISKWGSRSRG